MRRQTARRLLVVTTLVVGSLLPAAPAHAAASPAAPAHAATAHAAPAHAAASPSPSSTPGSSVSTVPLEPLRIGQRWRGQLPDDGSAAAFGLSLRAPQHLALRLDQPDGADVDVGLSTDGRELLRQRAPEAGEDLELELWLDAGDYELTLRPTMPAEGRYRLLVHRLDPFVVPADAEPNDEPALAREVPASLRWEGGPAGAEPDVDGFWLPALTTPGDVRIHVSGEPPLMRLFADPARSERLELTDGGESLLVAAEAPMDRPLYLEVEAEGPYGLEVEADGWSPADDVLAPPVELELALDDPDELTCPGARASLSASLTVIDAGAEPLELELRTATSDPAWQLRPAQRAVSLASGESVVVPVSIEVAPGGCGNEEVALSVAAVTAQGGLVSTLLTLDPGGLAPGEVLEEG